MRTGPKRGAAARRASAIGRTASPKPSYAIGALRPGAFYLPLFANSSSIASRARARPNASNSSARRGLAGPLAKRKHSSACESRCLTSGILIPPGSSKSRTGSPNGLALAVPRGSPSQAKPGAVMDASVVSHSEDSQRDLDVQYWVMALGSGGHGTASMRGFERSGA